MKICAKCNERPRTITRTGKTAGSVLAWCRECTRAYERLRRQIRRQHENKYYRNTQKKVVEMYGGKCVCCGETEHKFLEIDHINGGGSKERRASTDIEGFYRKLLREKSEDFRVLCSNCNRGRWRNGGQCPHQVTTNELISQFSGC